MVTLKDIAKQAGVSAMTVSRVVNKNARVSDETRKRVMKAIRELKYKPNTVARSLVTKQTRTIGLLIASISNIFYADVVHGVEDYAHEKGYNVILCNADGKQREKEYIDVLIEKCVDGIIFSHLEIGIKQIFELKQLNIPCVLIDNEIQGYNTSNIYTNNVLGGYLATEYLIQLGHTKIAHIHGSLKYNQEKKNKLYTETFQFRIWKDRMTGYIDTLAKYNIAMVPEYIQEGDGTAENGVYGGYMAMKELLKLNDRPTAIYAANDLMAIGAINAIREAGFDVPDDFSVVGYDGICFSDMIYPKLTTIAQPRYEIGVNASKLLLDLIKDNNNIQNITLDPKLIVRGSTKKYISKA
ncbi:MAG: LacI family DNA-binding transcriptional regulator [Mahellales bacterium]